MRKRSGGLHCQTQQEFIELAQLSQQKCGLYYDDDLNRKKTQLQNKNISKTKHKKPQKSNQPQPKPNLFLDFDFNQDDMEDKQTLIQLNNSSNKHLTLNITIICSNPQYERIQLHSIIHDTNQDNTYVEMGSFEEKTHTKNNQNKYQTKSIDHKHSSNIQGEQPVIELEQRVIDLYVHKVKRQETGNCTAYRFWFVRINSIHAEICQAYLNFSTQIFRIDRKFNYEGTTDLAQHIDLKSGKRHAIRDASDCSEILTYLKIGEDPCQQMERDPYQQMEGEEDVSAFSPQYLSNEAQFFSGWGQDERFLGRR